MTSETRRKLEKLTTYASRSLARDHAMDIIRELPIGEEKREAEIWYAQNLGWSASQGLRSKYNV